MKKLIILTILMLTSINAKIEIPEDVSCDALKNIVEHGWSDNNATLNAFILKSATRAIPKTLTHIEKPLVYEDDEKIPDYKIPKIQIGKTKYIQLFSYVKYLEHEGRDEEAYKIYLESLKGLNNISSEQFISVMFRMANEKVIVQSLQEWSKHKTFSKEFIDKLSHLLLVDNQYLLDVVKSEKKLMIKNFEKHFSKKVQNKDDEKLMKKTLYFTKKYIEEDYQLQVKAINSNSFQELQLFREKERNKYNSFSMGAKSIVMGVKAKIYAFIGLENRYNFIAHYIAKRNTIATTPKIIQTCKEYLEQVEENRKFLKRLSK